MQSYDVTDEEILNFGSRRPKIQFWRNARRSAIVVCQRIANTGQCAY